MLEAKPEDIGFADGRFPLAGTNRSVGLAEVATLAVRARTRPASSRPPSSCRPPSPFRTAATLCEVEIDPETGVVEIVRYSIVEDIGNVLNAKLAHGQIQGGVAMGIGQAHGRADHLRRRTRASS